MRRQVQRVGVGQQLGQAAGDRGAVVLADADVDNQDKLTQDVRRRVYAKTPDARCARSMTSLVGHLHAFAREVDLKGDEWLAGIEFLTARQDLDDKRQEFILLSDTLGLSMLVVALEQRARAEGPQRRARRRPRPPCRARSTGKARPSCRWAATSPKACRASPRSTAAA